MEVREAGEYCFTCPLLHLFKQAGEEGGGKKMHGDKKVRTAKPPRPQLGSRCG